ncbi:hypothetical protein BDZ89DRAFT_1056041 [Hymenopellis radicata]|nr:hypothetical protein BDZ89DRAFT_1056041 [Hymenopellis radicata]
MSLERERYLGDIHKAGPSAPVKFLFSAPVWPFTRLPGVTIDIGQRNSVRRPRVGPFKDQEAPSDPKPQVERL